MTLRRISLLLALAKAYNTLAQVFANGPFQLHVGSVANTSIDGHAYPCLDTLGLCYEQGVMTLPSKGAGVYFTSRAQADYTTGYLSWHWADNGAVGKNGIAMYGPVGLVYDPGTNVAVPIFNQTGSAEVLGFDSTSGNLMMTGIDDTTMSNSSNSGNSITLSQPYRYYNNWYLCNVQLEEGLAPELLISWVLGANLGRLPTNPTCQRINITIEAIAMGYGGTSSS
ncbi:uncharacterized protein F4807DRAFT_279713 [Annulohypoxylon truncatum]|uniref:uncharacterized protein n=1 Tax=Annulohypoxylon truncatum TaxID=327061 RepID=UPI0020081242|nr:uncharacterized protein F4807DRAFT_279713 [Annulohypoxylon truncatum]KAI1205483.1 hypothetical protein F4807DRAFT_279713 [Annulohypoxylon truncatum]